MKKSVLSTALSTAFIVALGFGVSACGGDKEESHEVLAVERVEEAATLARANAPAAEEMDFPETAPMPVAAADSTAVEGAATTDATMTDAATATAGAETAETATADGAEASVDGAATADASPVTDEAAAQ
ncbi:hypothetical protein [Psychrobacter aquaticus]|uniref:Lipoprotein n=1 Tax=Psychrobacter aquaticus CMS 56 TaxID=1354303 RepID=U4T989_9GAMM|nr:hypothetical protein [Psychrobacter aquaticus]ERL55284.1 hypothetical protein M917_1808 [Psychrobacter aquaticus CMS 56]